MKIAFVVSAQTTSFDSVALSGDLAKHLSLLANIGYGGVELAVRAPSAIDPAIIQGMCRSSKLSIAAIGTGQAFIDEGLSITSPDPAIRDKAKERLAEHVALSTAMGGPDIVIGSIRGMSSATIGRAEAAQYLAETLTWLADAAKEGGAGDILLEPLNRYETDLVNNLDEGAQLLEILDKPNIKLLADTFHMNIEEADPPASLARNARHIGHLHVADSNRWAPGYGHIDFPKWLGALFKAGFRGWTSVECLPKPESTAVSAIGKLLPWLRQAQERGRG